MPHVGVRPKNPNSAPSDHEEDALREWVLPMVSGEVAGQLQFECVALWVAP